MMKKRLIFKSNLLFFLNKKISKNHLVFNLAPATGKKKKLLGASSSLANTVTAALCETEKGTRLMGIFTCHEDYSQQRLPSGCSSTTSAFSIKAQRTTQNSSGIIYIYKSVMNSTGSAVCTRGISIHQSASASRCVSMAAL